MKPRTRVCWHCGRKLRGNHFLRIWCSWLNTDEDVIIHKNCLNGVKDDYFDVQVLQNDGKGEGE